MLKLSDLALRPDFQVGPMLVSPPRRLVEGPGGFVHVEPLIMQVFLLLLDGGGKVVTRNELFDQCWGGVYVGDDSLNRAIAKVRRIGAQVAPGLFEIETIPRTGYRLTGEILQRLDGDTSGPSSVQRADMSRRVLIGGGAASVALVGGAGIWWKARSQDDARFDELMREGAQAISDANEFAPEVAKRSFEEAVRLRPDSASAWGWLAYVRSVLAAGSAPKDSAAAVKAAEDAAHRALALDPREPNGLLAMFELQGSTLDWWTRDRRLRQIIDIDPANVNAIAELVLMLQAAGLSRESWNWNERALQLQPLSMDFLGKRALKLWIAGRISTADKVIDQLRALYPTNPWPWWIRFCLYALTDRPQAAQAMVDSDPNMLGGADGPLWLAGLRALERRSTATIAKAREAASAAARSSGDLAGQAVMIMAALGDVDASFAIADGFLLSRGSIVRRGQPNSGPATDALYRVNTQWLFTPPCAEMRADPRFLTLCEGMGLTEYWRRRGVKPDFMLTRDAQA